MTQKITVTFEVDLTLFRTPKGHGARGHRDLLYDPKVHGDLCGRFDLVYYPKKITGSLEVAMTYFDPKGHGDLFGRFDLVYDPKRSRSH